MGRGWDWWFRLTVYNLSSMVKVTAKGPMKIPGKWISVKSDIAYLRHVRKHMITFTKSNIKM